MKRLPPRSESAQGPAPEPSACSAESDDGLPEPGGCRVARALLERLPTGALLADGTGRVVLANRRGEATLRRDDGLSIRNACLRAATAQHTQALLRLVAECAVALPERGAEAGGPLALPRPSGERPLAVLVSPLAAPGAGDARCALAVVLVSDGRESVTSRAGWLRSLYGLTPAEAALALRLANGESLEDAARHLGIRIATARTQLKHALAKTGLRRQVELVRLLLTGPALVPAGEAEP